MSGKLPSPQSPRELFNLFRFYRRETGLEGLFANVDLENVSPRQVYYVVHGRMPESAAAATGDIHHPISRIFIAAVSSQEFRELFIQRFLAAFPEKKRILFVHIPKCAGSNLSAHLINRYASLRTDIVNPEICSQDDFFISIKNLVLECAVSEVIYVHGHEHLATYDRWNVARFNDHIITIIRPPIDTVISQINYVITRIFSDEYPSSPDTLGWRNEFNITPDQIENPQSSFIKDLAVRILHNRGVVPENVICRFLGDGTYKRALERVITHDVEVTDMAHYNSWCKDRWDITHDSRINESKKFISFDDFSAIDQEEISSIIQEDQVFYNLASKYISQSDKPYFVGRDIFEISKYELIPDERNKKKLENDSEDYIVSNAELMLNFESLGENCEFGLVQRRCDVDPLGLFRFSSTPFPRLMDALGAKFSGLGELSNLEIQLSANEREYMVFDKRFGFLYHAWVLVGDMTPEDIATREARRLPLLIRKLLELLSSGEKIFVYHGMEPLSLEQAQALSGALRYYGPTTLLWVELANEDHGAATVEEIEPGLLKGYMDRFAPSENAHDLSLDCWINLCRNAYALVKSEA